MKKLLLIAFMALFTTALTAQNRDVLIEEHFNYSTMPDGWSIDAHADAWLISETANAGGSPYEIGFERDPYTFFYGNSRLVSPAVDLTEVSRAIFEFKHFFENHGDTHTLSIATSSNDGATWHTAWSQNYQYEDGQYSVSQDITTDDFGKPNVRFSIVYVGDSYDIDGWYFDDIVVRACAYDFESGGIYYNITSETDKTVAVTYRDDTYNSYSGAVTIPATVTNGAISYSVTSIGERAFLSCSDLTDVTIPNSVTLIGWSSFFECTGLTNVTIPNSVVTIEGSAFEKCSHLTNVTIGNSVNSIGTGAFATCENLTMIDVASENASYSAKDGVLFDKDQQTLITYPNKKSDTYTIPNSVTSVGSYAFYKCANLTNISIPSSVDSIGDWAFAHSGLVTIYNYRVLPQSISDGTFDGAYYATLYVPTGSSAVYRIAIGWAKFDDIQEFDAQGVEVASGNEIQIAAADNTITVKGAEEHAKVEVYGVNGVLIYSGAAKSVAVPTHGIYIVRVAGVTKKVAL